jgi:hypothetical protein
MADSASSTKRVVRKRVRKGTFSPGGSRTPTGSRNLSAGLANAFRNFGSAGGPSKRPGLGSTGGINSGVQSGAGTPQGYEGGRARRGWELDGAGLGGFGTHSANERGHNVSFAMDGERSILQELEIDSRDRARTAEGEGRKGSESSWSVK